MKEYENKLLEEQDFPYLNISYEDAKKLRYLFYNIPALKEYEILRMSLKNTSENITANGMLYSPNGNATFSSEIIYDEENSMISIFTLIELCNRKDYYSIDVFRLREKNIEAISSIEKHDKIKFVIPYYDETLNR